MKLHTVAKVDLYSYLGKWYEIARFDSWFERNCCNVTAEYSLNTKGHITVVNTCYMNTPTGDKKQSKGYAKVVGQVKNSKLTVSFLPRFLRFLDPIFNGKYWILKLEPDYSIALVGEPRRKYLWILSRTPEISKSQYEEYVSAAAAMGFDISKLHKTLQQWPA